MTPRLLFTVWKREEEEEEKPLPSSVHPLLHLILCPAAHLQLSACNTSCLPPYELQNTQPTGDNAGSTAHENPMKSNEIPAKLQYII